MNAFVVDEVAESCEGFIAAFAMIRSLACVRTHVNCEIGFLGEDFTTAFVLAYELLT